MSETSRPWYRELNGYHWFVLVVCTLGWLFDCADQQLFNLARKPAVTELLQVSPDDPSVAAWGGYATSLMLIGWATGGIIFGIMGDRIGRARTMVWTILMYSVFTGLCGFSLTIWDFLFYRFMTGLGVGGQFAVGVSLVAETLPDRARAPALGLLQAFSTTGNMGAAVAALVLGQMAMTETIDQSPWRWMFALGVLPALLAVIVMRKLKEPERWQKAVGYDSGQKQKAGSLVELFGNPLWRKRVIVGMILASSGVIGLWGIGFFSIDLNRSIFRKIAEEKYRIVHSFASASMGTDFTCPPEIDRQFLCAIVASPQFLENDLPKGKVKNTIKPQNLIGPEAALNKDPHNIYAAVLTLQKAGKPVSVEAVLAALDEKSDLWKPQSSEDRERRAAYLAAATKPGEDFNAMAAAIVKRQRLIDGYTDRWGALTSLMFNLGAFFGVYSFSRVTQYIGRRPTFVIFFSAAFVTTVVAFLYMNKASDVFWMVPIMGFCQLSVFGGYAIYFPELFPTRLRSTGVSFCYNIGRFAAALGPSALGLLTSEVFTPEKGYAEPMRYAGVAMCSIFLIGIVVLAFAPETKDKPLPE